LQSKGVGRRSPCPHAKATSGDGPKGENLDRP
jgi:hypothetical protein